MLMYEMLLGQSPFRGDDEDEIFDAILEDEPLYPITMPRDAVSILQKVGFVCSAPGSAGFFQQPLSIDGSQLLTRDPTRRLGSGKGDAEEIKRQPFFKDVNWDDVFNKRIPPPYFPTIVSPPSCPLGDHTLKWGPGFRRTVARIRVISMKNSQGNSRR